MLALKKTSFTSLIHIYSVVSFSQIVNIPDANFKNYLISNTSINYNNDTEIQVSEANSFSGIIFAHNLGISDLTGIEAFTSVKILNCSSNLISSLDLSFNTNLQSLYCNHNSLSNLNLINNTNLNHLQCNNNQISNILLPSNSDLRSLFCSDNQLSEINTSVCPLLSEINCAKNQIDSLNLNSHPILKTVICNNNILAYLKIKNTNTNSIVTFNSKNNAQISCIEVDNVIWAASHLVMKDNWSTYSTSCP